MGRIGLAAKYSRALNMVYKEGAKTAVLDTSGELVRDGANANEIVIPSLSMDGLADYDRSFGFESGSVNLTWSTIRFNYERGRMFTVDAMDNEESLEIAFGKLAGEFMRQQVIPELDTFKLSKIASTPGISDVEATLSTGANVVAALRTAAETMDEAEIEPNERYLFITPTLYGLVEDMDTYKSKAVLSRFAQIITVPQTRMYTEIYLYDGVSEGEERGGYVKAEDGKDINFLVVSKPSVVSFSKHVVSKIITPEQNQTADAWKFGYRSYGITTVLRNKTDGIYCHHNTT